MVIFCTGNYNSDKFQSLVVIYREQNLIIFIDTRQSILKQNMQNYL